MPERRAQQLPSLSSRPPTLLPPGPLTTSAPTIRNDPPRDVTRGRSIRGDRLRRGFDDARDGCGVATSKSLERARSVIGERDGATLHGGKHIEFISRYTKSGARIGRRER